MLAKFHICFQTSVCNLLIVFIHNNSIILATRPQGKPVTWLPAHVTPMGGKK